MHFGEDIQRVAANLTARQQARSEDGYRQTQESSAKCERHGQALLGAGAAAAELDFSLERMSIAPASLRTALASCNRSSSASTDIPI